MESTSFMEMTARSGTLQNRAILARSLAGMARSERQISTSGWIPMESSSLTECWVGLVFTSPAAAR
ncbi:hypothetical protein D3C85_1112040 [compost metagenome]